MPSRFGEPVVVSAAPARLNVTSPPAATCTVAIPAVVPTYFTSTQTESVVVDATADTLSTSRRMTIGCCASATVGSSAMAVASAEAMNDLKVRIDLSLILSLALRQEQRRVSVLELPLRAHVGDVLVGLAVDPVALAVVEQLRVAAPQVDVAPVIEVHEVRALRVVVVEQRHVQEHHAPVGADVLHGAEADLLVQHSVLEPVAGEPVDLRQPARGCQQVLGAAAVLIAALAPLHAMLQERDPGVLGEVGAGDVPAVRSDAVVEPGAEGLLVRPGDEVALAEQHQVLDGLLVLDALPLRLGHLVAAAVQLDHEIAAREAERGADDLRPVRQVELLHGAQRRGVGAVFDSVEDEQQLVTNDAVGLAAADAPHHSAERAARGRGVDEDQLSGADVLDHAADVDARVVASGDADGGVIAVVRCCHVQRPRILVLLQPLEQRVEGFALFPQPACDREQRRGLRLEQQDVVGHVHDDAGGVEVLVAARSRDEGRGGTRVGIELRHETSPRRGSAAASARHASKPSTARVPTLACRKPARIRAASADGEDGPSPGTLATSGLPSVSDAADTVSAGNAGTVGGGGAGAVAGLA